MSASSDRKTMNEATALDLHSIIYLLKLNVVIFHSSFVKLE